MKFIKLTSSDSDGKPCWLNLNRIDNFYRDSGGEYTAIWFGSTFVSVSETPEQIESIIRQIVSDENKSKSC